MLMARDCMKTGPVPLNFWRGFTLHRMAFFKGTMP